MKGYGGALRKSAFLISTLLASLCLFAAITSARLENSLFSPVLHKSMLNSCDIYSQTGSIIKNSLDDYLKALEPGSPEALKQQEQLVSFIEKAITPEMIKLNIDSIVDGLLKYFKGETRFLPDIYINPVEDKPLQELQTDNERNDAVSGESLTEIDKINLSVILMYMNRSDITDKLSVVRLFYFTLSKIPFLAGILFAAALLAGLLLFKSKRELTRWVDFTALITGSAFILSGLGLSIHLYYILPANQSFISLSVPLRPESAAEYIQSWLYPTALFFIIAGIAAIVFVPLFRLLRRITPVQGNIARLVKSITVKKRLEICGIRLGVKPAIAVISLILILSFSLVYYGVIKKEFLSNDLTVAVERMKGITAFSRVVFAQDAAVNTLELRMVDRQTNAPVQGVYTNISGKSAVSGNTVNEDVASDAEGLSKTTLDMGSYKLSFDSAQFPDGYMLPPPYIFEMEAAGSTVITISLDKVEEPKPGTIEIQILDKDNLPVKGVELALANTETETGADTGSNIFSVTNSEGVAAFIADAGTYKALFLENGFPAEYMLPESMEIDLDSDETTKYSVKLVEKSVQSGETAGKKIVRDSLQ